jgi:hypothetical protein
MLTVSGVPTFQGYLLRALSDFRTFNTGYPELELDGLVQILAGSDSSR